MEIQVAGGGHAELGLVLHQALATASVFPDSLYLPVCLIPDDPTQYGYLRAYTWHRHELCLAGLWGVWIAEAINQAKEDYRQQVSPPREVVSVPANRARAAPQEYPVPVWWLIVWMAGIAAATLFSWHASAAIIWAGIGFLVPLLLRVKLGKARWGLIFPLTGIGMEAWAVLWHIVVEGGF